MRARRTLIGLALFLAIFAATAFLLRLPIAGHAVRTALADAGLKEAQFRVTALSLSGARLENLSAGAAGEETLRFDFIEAEFNWRRLLQRRELNAVTVGPGEVQLKLSPDGKIFVPGVELVGGDGGKPPFRSLTVSETALLLDTPQGPATGALSADYDVEMGARASFSLASRKAGTESIRIENAAVKFDVVFDADGAAQLGGSISGDVIADAMTARKFVIAIEASEISRGGVVGEALLKIEVAEIPVDLAPALAVLKEPAAALLGDPLTSLSFSGALVASAAGGDVALRLAPENGPAIIASNAGAVFKISELGGESFYRRESGADRAVFSYALSGANIEAKGDFDGEYRDGVWRFATPIRFDRYQSGRLAFENAAARIEGIVDSSQFAADISVNTILSKGKIGRLNIFDATVNSTFDALIDRNARRAVVAATRECLLLENIRATIDRQDTELRLSDAKFCADGEPVAVVEWSGTPKSTFKGRLTASKARYRLGATHLTGKPPQVEATAVYTPALNQTLITGDIEGGFMALNDLLNLASTKGHFKFVLDRELMRVDLRFDQTRVSQQREPPLIAPVLASGDFALVDRDATFDYVVTTLSGNRIGAGAGVHNVTTSSGESRLIFDEIAFAPGGMQPAALLPVLKGFAREATGAATGVADFSWTRAGGIDSSADIRLENMTFSGPTRIVNQTTGLNGDIQFKDLWPLTTAGAQSITVEGADLDALQLQHGAITFEMRGDEKLRVEDAVFPWFGGALGVDNAVIALSGGDAVAPLRADKIDLSQILNYGDIDGLSGEGVLSGVLPLVVKDGRAHIENGVLKSDSPGAIRYRGRAGEEAATAGGQAKMAFDLLRDLRYDIMETTINGPLDGRLQFQIDLTGTGEIDFNEENVRVPVNYHINLDAALLELLKQAELTRRIELQVLRSDEGED